MSDILIKGLALPKKGEVMKFYLCSDGDVGYVNDGNPYKTTAIELPEHGEAKDTDIAIRYIKNEMGDDFNETTTLDEKSYKEGMKRSIELIGYAPTVLEANNG